MSNDHKIFSFSDQPLGKQSIDSISDHGASTAILIDNGSYQIRAGYSSQNEPNLIFKNLIFKQKSRSGEPDIQLVGFEIENIEAMRSQLKSPFDKNIVSQFDTMEVVLDYTFSQLNVDSEGRVNHPIVITEPVINPNHSRGHMAELMFECYSVPSLGYAVDSLASWYGSSSIPLSETCLLIDVGYQATHVMPIINGNAEFANCRRNCVGGSQVNSYMQRLLQLKYPVHANAISLSRAEEIVHAHTFIASEYTPTCSKWANPEYYDEHVIKMQLPYSNVANNFALIAMQGEKQAERTRLLSDKQTLSKINDKLHILEELMSISEMVGPKLYRKLCDISIDSTGELQCHIKAVKSSLELLKRKISHKQEFAAGTLTQLYIQDKLDKMDNYVASEAELATFDVAEYYQLHVALEQIRAPEILLQPSLVGSDQAGAVETAAFVLSLYPSEIQQRLAENVILTGGCSRLPGLRDRVERDLRVVRPFQSALRIQTGDSPAGQAAWLGLHRWYNEGNRADQLVSRAEYEERGPEYFKESVISNKYIPTPSASVPNS